MLTIELFIHRSRHGLRAASEDPREELYREASISSRPSGRCGRRMFEGALRVRAVTIGPFAEVAECSIRDAIEIFPCVPATQDRLNRNIRVWGSDRFSRASRGRRPAVGPRSQPVLEPDACGCRLRPSGAKGC